MTAYVDSSVVLRLVLGQPGTLAEWATVTRAVTSRLTEVECLRTLDRHRLAGHLDAETHAAAMGTTQALLESFERVELTHAVLRRASEPFPTALRALDALHLATALLVGYHQDVTLVMATHDVGLAAAARSCGLRSLGT